MRVAFKLKLLPGQEDEYKRRHDALWPELEKLLRETGISEYSIFLDEKTFDLFGVLSIDVLINLELLPQQPIMKKWWAHMSDIMETNPDNSPITIPLKEVFYLP